MSERWRNAAMGRKRRILVDFDGTINSYRTRFDPSLPWLLPDPPLDGGIEFLSGLAKSGDLEPVIFTTRVWGWSKEIESRVRVEIRNWLAQYGLEPWIVADIVITAEKIPCSLIIDDHAYT